MIGRECRPGRRCTSHPVGIAGTVVAELPLLKPSRLSSSWLRLTHRSTMSRRALYELSDWQRMYSGREMCIASCWNSLYGKRSAQRCTSHPVGTACTKKNQRNKAALHAIRNVHGLVTLCALSCNVCLWTSWRSSSHELMIFLFLVLLTA